MTEFNDYTSVFRVRLGNDDVHAGNQGASGQRPSDAASRPQGQSSPRHRARPVISCHLCRARKQRCDRQLPCSTCVRRGHGAQCRYDSGHEAGTERRIRKTPLARTAAPVTHKSLCPVSSGTGHSGLQQAPDAPNAYSNAPRALAQTPESDAGPAADVLEDTQTTIRDTLPRQTAQKAQIRLQRLEAMVSTLLARTREGTASAPGIAETPPEDETVRTSAPTGEPKGTGAAAAPVRSDGMPTPEGQPSQPAPLPPRPRVWKPSPTPHCPCPIGGVVTQMIGATPTPAGTNWLAVLDGIRDIQSYLAELGADEQQGHDRGEPGLPGGSSWSDGSDTGGAETRYDQSVARRPHGTLTIAEPEGIFAMTAVVVGSDDAGGVVPVPTSAVPTPLSLSSLSPTASPFMQQRPPTLLPPLAASAVAALPSREECNRLLAVYFQMSFHIGPYVHLRQFQRAYARFWSTGNPAAAHPISPLLWLSMLASMLTAAAAFVDKTHSGEGACALLGGRPDGKGMVGGGDGGRCAAKERENKELLASLRQLSTRCLVAGNYLNGHPLSVEAMLLHIQVSIQEQGDVDPTMWATFGVVTRLAQRMGYQQVDAVRPAGAVQQKHLPYYKEMRRRAWYTIETFDVQYSFLFGIPSIIRSDETATNPPSNLLDDDFDEDTQVMPAARPLTEHTPVLFFITALTVIRMMRRVLEFAVWKLPSAAANGADKESRAATAAALAAEIQAHHRALPPRLRMPAHLRDCSFDDDHTAIIRKLILELLHHKAICVLFREAMGRGGGDEHLATENERHVREAQRRACLVSALRILDLHQDLFHEKWDTDYLAGASAPVEQTAETSPADSGGSARATPGPRPTPGAAGRLSVDNGFLCALSNNDFLMAATIVCLDLIEGGRSSQQSAAAEPYTAPSSMSASESSSSPSAHTPDSSSSSFTPSSASSAPDPAPLYFLGSAERSILERANDRAAKLAAVRAEYLMWNTRSLETNDGTHASRILGAIVGKLTAEDRAERREAAGGRAGAPRSEAASAPGTGPSAGAAPTTAPTASAAAGREMWTNVGPSNSGQPETTTHYGPQPIRVDSTADETAAAAAELTGPMMAMDMGAETPALHGAAQAGPGPMFAPLDSMETDPFDAFFGNPGNLDWNAIDTLLLDRQMEVDVGSFLWSADSFVPGM